MAPNMEQTARICFPAARRVTDRFHVQKLAYEAVQEMRVKARWEALDEESIQMAHARACGKIYHAPVFENGDSRKQLLARSIYLLYKKESLWTESQRMRAAILFREYPDIKKAYYLLLFLDNLLSITFLQITAHLHLYLKLHIKATLTIPQATHFLFPI